MANIKTISRSLLLPFQQRFALPQSFIYFVTSRCNAACEFCLYHDQLNNHHPNHIELTVDEVRKITSQYGEIHYLGLSGGEPFLRRDLKDICQAFVDNCSVKVIDIPSNFFYGEKMEEFIRDFFSTNMDVTLDLQLSLDNIGEKHDESRKVKGLFNRAISNFKALYSLKKNFPNLMLKINLVYLPSNRLEMKYILDTISNLVSFDRIHITYPHFLLKERSQNTDELVKDLELFFEVAAIADLMGNSSYKHDLYSLGLRSVKKLYREMLKKSLLFEKETGCYCEAGKNIVVMNEIGDIFPCEILWNEKIGNVRDYNYSVGAILLDDRYRKFRKRHLGKHKCNCTWSCIMNTEVSVNYKYFPSLAKNAFTLYLNKTT